MIFSVHLLMSKLLEFPFGQEIAETPSLKLLKVGLNKKISVEACSVPVDPRSTSASPLPKTSLLGFCRAASINPWKVGVDPNGPVHRLVPKKFGSNSHCRPVTAIVP